MLCGMHSLAPVEDLVKLCLQFKSQKCIFVCVHDCEMIIVATCFVEVRT